MKKNIPLILCGCAIILTLLFRSEVYDITIPTVKTPQNESAIKEMESPLTVHYHDRRPYYVSMGNEVHGLVADPIALILKAARIDFHWVNTPAKRQLNIIKKNESVTCAAGWFWTSEREKFGKYTLPVFQDSPFVAVARVDNSLLLDNESLDRVFRESRLRLLVKSGYSYGKYIDEKIRIHNPWQVVTTADNKSMLEMVQTHRADYCFMTKDEAHDLLIFAGMNKTDFKVINFNEIPEGNKRYLICSKKISDSDIDKLNGAIQYLLTSVNGK